MKLKTSFSDLTPLKKDITRFTPVWALYLVGLLMFLVNQVNGYDSYRQAATLPNIIPAFGIVNLIYAALCAQLLFGDLYNTRMCYSLHALPQRRETWLLNHFGAGFAFSLVPNLIASLIIMQTLYGPSYPMLFVLLAMELEFLFYFGLATVSVMVTGNRFAMLLVYAGLNFVSMLAYWILNTIYLPMLEGVVLDLEPFVALCPTVRLFEFDFMEIAQREIRQPNGFTRHLYEYAGLADGWGYLAALGVLGIGLMGLATLLYRWRHLESAGDFVAFSKLKVPMSVVMTLCTGGVCAVMGELILGDSMSLWLTVGIVVGYFGGLMLLERRLKVFRVKNIIGFVVLSALLICSYVMTARDTFGIVKWVPEANQVKSVTVANYGSSGYINYVNLNGRISVTLDQQGEIREIIDAHEDILRSLNSESDSRHRVFITYQLKSGRTVKRQYWAPTSGENYRIISKYFYTENQILGYQDWDYFLENMDLLHVNSSEISQLHYKAVMEALRADCAMGQVRSGGSISGESIGYVYYRSNNLSRELILLPGAEYTKAVLSKPEVILGYGNWEDFLENVTDINASGQNVKPVHCAALLEAIRTDCENGNISLLDDKDGVYWIEYHYSGRYRVLTIPSTAKETISYLQEHILP